MMAITSNGRPAWLRSLALLADTDKDGNVLVTATVDETATTAHLWGNLTIAICPRSRRIVQVARMAIIATMGGRHGITGTDARSYHPAGARRE